MSPDTAILALDPGGTKCHALLVGGDGRALGWGTSEKTTVGGRSESAIRLAAAGALASQRPASLAIISIHPRALKLGIPVKTMLGVPEREAALALAGEECGVVALAGTGSFIDGKTRNGRELHLDGMGPILGDTGSAHYIGLMAMRAAAKSGWHPRFQTSLLQRLFQHLGIQTLPELVAFSLKPNDRSVIAAFARIVDEEAAAGDAVARQIMRNAADELAEIARVAVERLEMGAQSYTLVGTGGVIRHSDIYWNRLCERVREFAPLLTPQRLAHPQVVGMALAGLRGLEYPDYDQAAAALLASYANVMVASRT